MCDKWLVTVKNKKEKINETQTSYFRILQINNNNKGQIEWNTTHVLLKLNMWQGR